MFATVARGVNVHVDANRSDEEPGRLNRLHRILGFVHALASHYGNHGLLDKVASVFDHKGDLTVCWRLAPSKGEIELFNKAWFDDVVGDAFGPVEHINEAEQTIARCEGPGMQSPPGLVRLHFQ